MKIMSLKLLLLVAILFPALSCAEINGDRSKLVGTLIKNALETYHYKSMKIDDDVSEKAFDEYLKRMDYAKQFYLQSDVEKLKKYRKSLDDQMTSGKLPVVEDAVKMLRTRVKQVDGFRKEIFKKKFDFNKKETLEVDSEKRTYVKTDKELKEHWRKLFKQSTLSRYLTLKEEQEEEEKALKEGKDKKGDAKDKTAKTKKAEKKKEPFKKLSDAELMAKANEKINEKYEKIFARVLKEDDEDYLEKYFNSLAMIFDPHTNYLPPKKKEDFDIDISGSLEGIGAVLQEDGSYIKVVRIVPGGAAWRQKDLEVEDVILAVGQADEEPVSLVDMRVDDAVRYIRGPKDSEVRLTVKKVDGSRKIIPIIRDVVQISDSFAKSSVIEHKDLDIKVGYIYVPKFYRDFQGDSRNVSDDVRKEIERMKKFGIDSLILDLRGNGGGALEDARKMSGLFIKKGPIVQIKGGHGKTDVLRDYNTEVVWEKPLVVMTDRFSASASEILAAAMQDYGRAIIVGGEHSHGKGTVQAVVNLNSNPLLSMLGPTVGALKVTIQKFYRINGSSTQYKGVTPDIIIPDPKGYAKNREQDLDYSLKWDMIQPLKYEPWDKYSYDLGTLKKRSESRVKKNPKFKKIQEQVDYFIQRREDTVVSLNKDEVIKEDKENEEIVKKFKIEDENKKIVVTHLEESLKDSEQIKPGDEKKWKEDFEQRKEEWVKQLRLDPGLEEAMYILSDVVNAQKGKPLAMIK